MTHTLPDILLNPWKKIVKKKIETRPQSSKNAKKTYKKLKNSCCRQNYTGVRKSINCLFFILELRKDNLNLSSDKSFLIIGSQIILKKKCSMLP